MINNVHEREFPGVEMAAVSALLDTLGQPDDRLWPRNGRWPPMILDGPLADLPAGGHGLVRYRTVEYVPGRKVVWRFDDEMGLPGTHRAELFEGATGPGLRHVISAGTRGSMRLLWPLAVRPLHDQCLDDLLDRASEQLGVAHEPSRPGWWTRFLLRVAPSPEKEMEMLARQAGRSA